MGRKLIQTLIEWSEAEGYWTLSAEILAANEGSRLLHQNCGFREIGYREMAGHRKGVWHDVILLERRSKVVGGVDLPTRICSSSLV